jgi:hypothetical protein
MLIAKQCETRGYSYSNRDPTKLERAVDEIFAEAATGILKNPLLRENCILPGQLHRRKLDRYRKPHTGEALRLHSEHLAEIVSEVRSPTRPPTGQKELRES